MFRECKTEKEVKELYRSLSKYLHPDRGGNHDLFIKLTQAYEKSLGKTEGKKEESNKDSSKIYTTQHQDISVFSENIDFTLFAEILLYSKNHPRFKIDFLMSVIEFGKENKFVTSSQYNSLVKVYYSFRMDREECELAFLTAKKWEISMWMREGKKPGEKEYDFY